MPRWHLLYANDGHRLQPLQMVPIIHLIPHKQAIITYGYPLIISPFLRTMHKQNCSNIREHFAFARAGRTGSFGLNSQTICLRKQKEESLQAASKIVVTTHTSPFQGVGIIMLGAPCSGKGTQAKVLAQAFGLTHISSGAVVSADPATKPYVDNGELVPDKAFFAAMKAKLDGYDKDEVKCLIKDGWLRHAGQLGQVMNLSWRLGIKRFVALEFGEVSENELVRRMFARTSECKRTDDKEFIFRDRLKLYQRNHLDIVTALSAVQCPFAVVNASEHPDTVFINTIIALKSIL